MHTNISHLAKLFQGVKEIREVIEYDLISPDMEVTSIDDLIYGFGAYIGKKIRFLGIPDLKDELLRGVYLPYGNEIIICLDRTMNDNWLKYIQVKEMCNLILNEDQYKTVDPALLLELMIHEEASSPVDGEAPLDLVSDMWSKYAAHELLFPFAYRDWAREQLGKTETLFSLAERFGIPETVIEFCLSQTYHDQCKEVWDDIGL